MVFAYLSGWDQKSYGAQMSKQLMANFECASYDPTHWWTEKQDLDFSKIVRSFCYLEGDQHSCFHLGLLLKHLSFLLPFSVHRSVLFSVSESETSGCSSFVRNFSSCHAPPNTCISKLSSFSLRVLWDVSSVESSFPLPGSCEASLRSSLLPTYSHLSLFRNIYIAPMWTRSLGA